MRVIGLLLLVLAGPVLAVETEDRSALARLAYAKSPAFLTTLRSAMSEPSPGRLDAEEAIATRPPRLRLVTFAAAEPPCGLRGSPAAAGTHLTP